MDTLSPGRAGVLLALLHSPAADVFVATFPITYVFSPLFLHSVLLPAQRHLSSTRGVQSRDAGQGVWGILKLSPSSGML